LAKSFLHIFLLIRRQKLFEDNFKKKGEQKRKKERKKEHNRKKE